MSGCDKGSCWHPDKSGRKYVTYCETVNHNVNSAEMLSVEKEKNDDTECKEPG